jgi:4-alpha-glucanotransferase
LSNGDFGHDAYRFIEFLSSCGFRVWQMLPLGPTHEDKSPYQCLSSHAGNPLLISLSWLSDRSWLDTSQLLGSCEEISYRKNALIAAGKNFYNNLDDEWVSRFDEFKQQSSFWLDDFSLFMALKKKYDGLPWYMWPSALRDRTKAALAKARQELSEDIAQVVFEQFVFFTQWHELREYAHAHEVMLFGDMPIFVAHDSADIWSHRECFLSDKKGELSFVAGVPPDAFSDTGQRWGNPLYDWEYMQSNGFSWWEERFKSQLKLFDLIRIDHFRGLESYWEIPATEDTAMNGRWVEAPGKEFLGVMLGVFDRLPIVAEDLGLITKEVIELRKSFNLPGMKILQFAFGGDHSNPYLPHNHDHHCVVYTGTHDNDTTLGWYAELDDVAKGYFTSYVNPKDCKPLNILSAMVRMALASVSPLAILPMQDILALDSSHRMNIPGTVEGNWQWRFSWEQMSPELSASYNELLSIYDRVN